jgi:hypothetical protein
VDQAEVALLDEVEEADARGPTTLGHGDHEAEVRPYEGRLRLGAGLDLALQLEPSSRALLTTIEGSRCPRPRLDGLRQPDLVVPGEERVAADLVQVRAHQVLCPPEPPIEALARRRSHPTSLVAPRPGRRDHMRSR